MIPYLSGESDVGSGVFAFPSNVLFDGTYRMNLDHVLNFINKFPAIDL